MSPNQKHNRRSPTWWLIVRRGALLTVAAIVIHTMSPILVDLASTAPELRTISPWWFAVMALLETGSFVAAWGLTRLAVPGLGWGVAAISQLSSNSAARVMPGGAVVSSALYYRILAASGVPAGSAAAALTLNSLVSTAVLLALPPIAAVIAAFSAPIPPGLLPVAFGGLVVFFVLVAVGTLSALFDAPLVAMTRLFGSTIGLFQRSRSREPRTSTTSDDRIRSVLAHRDSLIQLLGRRWHQVVALAALNWLLDYLALVAAIYAVGAQPRLSVVLLAFTASAVLTMIPITPGGLGFVEAGLVTALTIAGIPAADALLATLAYRVIAFWLPIPAGGIAYLVFRHQISRNDGDPRRTLPAT